MIEIIEYKKEYREEIINLWFDICINEFGFDEWKNDIKNMNNDTFIYNKRKFLDCFKR